MRFFSITALRAVLAAEPMPRQPAFRHPVVDDQTCRECPRRLAPSSIRSYTDSNWLGRFLRTGPGTKPCFFHSGILARVSQNFFGFRGKAADVEESGSRPFADSNRSTSPSPLPVSLVGNPSGAGIYE